MPLRNEEVLRESERENKIRPPVCFVLDSPIPLYLTGRV